MNIDVKKMRTRLDQILGQPMGDAEEMHGRMVQIAGGLTMALDDLEALRKAPTAYDFDVKAAREELARIDRAWSDAPTCTQHKAAFDDANRLLNKALAAIDAGWPEPAGDVVERAALALRNDVLGDDAEVWPAHVDEWARETYRRNARAVLRSAGRLREPVAITDAVVEEAARIGWCVSYRETAETWAYALDATKATLRRVSRAVLEYAASRGAAPAPTVSQPFRQTTDMPRLAILAACVRGSLSELATVHRLSERIEVLERERSGLLELSGSAIFGTVAAPIDTGAAERLTRYREALLMGNAPAILAKDQPLKMTWASDVAEEIEAVAHAMLAAERTHDARR